MAKNKEVKRIEKLNNNVAIASTGEFSDFQEVMRLLRKMEESDFLANDKVTFGP
jgi:20S proteasome alpha/beta subunit